MANPRICSVPGCGKSHFGRDYCRTHYARAVRYGTTVATPAGVPMSYIETVVLPYVGDECLPWPYARNRHGYGVVRVSGRNEIVSRYVCKRTHGNPPSDRHEAAHSCGNGKLGCVNKRHLRWATSRENSADALMHGTAIHGEKHVLAKLTPDEVREIRSLAGQIPQTRLAKRFGISPSAISEITNRKRYSRVI